MKNFKRILIDLIINILGYMIALSTLYLLNKNL